MNVRALGYLGVTSPRAGDWRQFGTEVLGMRIAEPDKGDGADADGAVRLRMDDRAHRITVYPGEADQLRYLGWEVADGDELETFAAHCRRRGVPHHRATDTERAERGVLDLVWLTDPAGFRHEVYYGQDRSPVSLPPRMPLNRFVTGEQGLGHAVLVVPELDAADRFCREILGLRASDQISTPFDLRFFHCNPRHHSLALAGVPGMRGLHHVMVQLDELDDVGVAYDLCQRQGLPITMTLGRHTNDRMVSFYVRTPSGFDVEYGWGALEIGVSWTVARFDRPSVWGHQPADLPPGAVESVSVREPAEVDR